MSVRTWFRARITSAFSPLTPRCIAWSAPCSSAVPTEARASGDKGRVARNTSRASVYRSVCGELTVGSGVMSAKSTTGAAAVSAFSMARLR